MPRWEQDNRGSGPTVQGFTERGFAVDGRAYHGLLMTPHSADDWNPPPVAELSIEHLSAVITIEPPPEFLILGTGKSIIFPPRALIRALDEKGIGIEVMDSRAAARTWGMLRGEERWISAALMPFAL